jgi:thiol:disulfide interchange protein DsbD
LWRLLIGIAFLAFGLSLTPGMFGGKLGELDAYVPLSSGSSGFGTSSGESLTWTKDQFPEAIAKARQENKLVFVNFTGYACTNCHWMKANMFTRPEIRAALQNFVLLDLYTDGSDEASRLNGELEEKTFGTAAIPFYAIFDTQGKVLASFPGLTRNPKEFLTFLNTPSSANSAPATPPAGG